MARFATPLQVPPPRDFVLSFGVPVPKRPDEYRMNCPRCGDTHGKLYVNIKKGYIK